MENSIYTTTDFHTGGARRLRTGTRGKCREVLAWTDS